MRKIISPMRILILIIFSATLSCPTAMASSKTLDASYGVQILYESKLLSSTAKPFIAGGTTYVPLRMLVETFDDRQITWDSSSNLVFISQIVSNKEPQYESRIKELETQIKEAINTGRIPAAPIFEESPNPVPALSALPFTEVTSRTLEPKYGVQVYYNQKKLDSAAQPFIVDGTTYVPLRMLIEAFDDKKITWDGNNNNVLITEVKSLQAQQYEDRITELEAQLQEIEETNKALRSKTSVFNPQNIESSLNSKYLLYEDLDAKFSVTGTCEVVEVTLDTTIGKWITLPDSKKTDLIKGICTQTWNESSFAKINGYIKEGNTEFYRFSFRPGDNPIYEGFKIDDVAHDLNIRYGEYKSADLDFKLTGTISEMTLNIDVSDHDWNMLYKYGHDAFLLDVCSFIWSKAPDASIRCYVKDRNDTLFRFTTKWNWPMIMEF